MSTPNPIAEARMLCGLSPKSLAAMCMMSISSLAAVEAAPEVTSAASEAVKRTLEFHGIQFDASGVFRKS